MGRMRANVKFSTTFLSIGLLLIYVHQNLLPRLATSVPGLDHLLFIWGFYGLFATETYISSSAYGPVSRASVWDTACGDGFILITPNGPSVKQPGPMILDSRGNMIWTSADFGVSSNLQVQTFQGREYLTFWAGDKAVTTGKGLYYMLDSTYSVVHVVRAVGNDILGDLHEFQITPQGTALITVYNVTKLLDTDSQESATPRNWIIDSVFQEIDIETGQLLFEWKASDHFRPSDSFMTNPFAGYHPSMPFDFYHINSVDKDALGNYLISSRHFHSITCISPSGETLWILGGRGNEFRDLSNGQATNFKWQHHARWISASNGVLSIFDNGKAGNLHVDALQSRGMLINLDVANRTAELLQSLASDQGILASSQGSMQVLDTSNHMFVGWGSAAAYSEYNAKGQLLCEVQFGASLYYWFERIKSYRAIKTTTWRGFPSTRPSAMIQKDNVFVSWNGATEVAFWELQILREDGLGNSSCSSDNEHIDLAVESDIARPFCHQNECFTAVETIAKTKFEESFQLPQSQSSTFQHARYRVLARDAELHVLQCSDILLYDLARLPSAVTSRAIWFALEICSLIGFALGIRLILKLSPILELFRPGPYPTERRYMLPFKGYDWVRYFLHPNKNK